MLIPIMILVIVLLGVVAVYIHFISPRLNPEQRIRNFMDQNMFSEAEAELEKILESDPNNFKAHYQLGDLYFSQDMIDKGVLQFEEVLRINKFTHEVDRYDIMRRLGRVYLSREQIDRAFRCFFEISRAFPADTEALYHIAFISLGQEMFDFAQKNFDRLVKSSKDLSMPVLFGAGIASYQTQRITEAAEYFRQALLLEPNTQVTNLAMAFALQRKRDFKNAIIHAKLVANSSSERDAIIISKRLLGLLYFQSRDYDSAISVYEELLDYIKQNDLQDELVVILYDMGFVCIRGENLQQAYEYWNQIYLFDRNYRNVQHLTTLLRKEMDSEVKKKLEPLTDSVQNYVDDWIKDTFPEDFMWDICGLKSPQQIDLKSIVVTYRISDSKGGRGEGAGAAMSSDDTERINRFLESDVETFRIMANRICLKLGFNVDEILNTYREADGVDFMATANDDRKKTLIWVRRWKGAPIGEIPLRNFSQAINDAKADKGLFVSTAPLSPAAENSLARLSKVTVIYPEHVGALLDGISI